MVAASALRSREQVRARLSDDVVAMIVQVVGPVFKKRNRWRLTYGTGAFFAAVEDGDFLSRVLKNEVSFRAGDVLRVRMRRMQRLEGETLHTDHIVLKVLEHRPAAVQLRLTAGREGE